MSNIQTQTVDRLTTEILIYKQQAAQNIIEIGKRLMQAKEQLPHGEWGKWLEEKVEFKRETARKFMNAAEQLGNSQAFGNLSQSKVFALLDLPKEERETFIAETDIDSMTTRQLQQAIKEKKQAEARIAELENRKPEVKIVEKQVIPSDYHSLKNKISTMELKQKEEEQKIKRLTEDKNLLERKVKLNQEEAKEYQDLKSNINKLKQEKNSLSRQIEAATELSALIVRIEHTLKTELAPVKYSRAINEQKHDDIVQRNLKEIIQRVKEWCYEMESYIPDNNYIDAKVVDINE